jgi:hypothetical protein
MRLSDIFRKLGRRSDDTSIKTKVSGISDASDDWKILQDYQTVSVEAPDFDLEGFPFGNRKYVCLTRSRFDRESGLTVIDSRGYYADEEALSRVGADIKRLEGMLTSDVTGIESLPRLETNLSLMTPVTDPNSEFPYSLASLSLRPLTPTGRKSKYPVTVNFTAYRHKLGEDNDGSHGTISYLYGGGIGKAEIYFWHQHVGFGAHYKLIDGRIALNVLEYCDDPSVGFSEIFRAQGA